MSKIVWCYTSKKKKVGRIAVQWVNPSSGNAPYFIILLCLTPDDILLVRGRVLPLNVLIKLSAYAPC
jgi:hypothetical protein